MLSPSQQMFMLFFSILYGIMLNSLIGLGAFPIGHALAGVDVKSRDENDKPVFVKGNRSRNRLALSIVLLNLLPFIYFAVAFQFIEIIGDIPSTSLAHTIPQIFSIGLLSLSVFAFYDFFYGCIAWKPCGNSLFYTHNDLRRLMSEKTILPNPQKYILGGCLYLITPWLVIFLFRALSLI